MIAYEYANAIYEIAVEEKKVDLFNDYFIEIVDTFTGDFLKVLESPSIEVSKKKETIKTVFKSLDASFVNFLLVLIDNDRIGEFKNIGHQYRKFVRKYKNIVIIDVFSVNKLTKAQLATVANSLKDKYPGKELEIKNVVNPDLIGGIRIVCNGEALDMSLKSTIDRLKESL